eukprot:jgi/Chrzof1/6917/Cz02g03100.t1
MGLFDFLYAWMCRRVFNKVDYNKNGQIEPLEVEVAVLQLYNIVNKRLPGWQDPPTRPKIQAALETFDADHNGSLNPQEFERFAKSLLKAGPDTFFARVGKDALIKTALIPSLSLGVKRAAQALPGLREHVGNVPLAVMAPALGVIFSAVRSLIPV